MEPQNTPETPTPENPKPEVESSPAPEAQPTPAPVQQNPSPAPAAKPAKGYGKRPVWQWVLLYVIIAIIVYGLVYVLFIHKSGGAGSSTGY